MGGLCAGRPRNAPVSLGDGNACLPNYGEKIVEAARGWLLRLPMLASLGWVPAGEVFAGRHTARKGRGGLAELHSGPSGAAQRASDGHAPVDRISSDGQTCADPLCDGPGRVRRGCSEPPRAGGREKRGWPNPRSGPGRFSQPGAAAGRGDAREGAGDPAAALWPNSNGLRIPPRMSVDRNPE